MAARGAGSFAPTLAILLGIVTLIPLNGASKALNEMHSRPLRATLETFVEMQASYWKMVGYAIGWMIVFAILVVFAGSSGALSTLVKEMAGG